ncbi:MAG: DNRLRE domain-containing protein [Anaerolineae bacterium]|nr:DNRLRE domain-containing protein [Anaerolineae bacterium]
MKNVFLPPLLFRLIIGFTLITGLLSVWIDPEPQLAQANTPTRRVNAAYFNGDMGYSNMSVFWFGQVDNTNNYVDVRVGYNDESLQIRTSTFDRRLWYNTSLASNPNPAALTEGDAVTLYLDLNHNGGSTPDTDDYQFTTQLNWWEARNNYQAVYQGNHANWAAITLPYATTTNWRGNAPNDDTDDRGWVSTITIPFSSLGLSGPPPKGSIWGMGMVLHDQDRNGDTTIADKNWPETLDKNLPNTWGELAFGMPTYTPPSATVEGTTTIRHKRDGAIVTDAHIGGDTVCGDTYAPNFFNGWGDANYAGSDHLNIQNQGDVADWPCFSKMYVSFPLDKLPEHKKIISAELILHQFGGSNPSQAKPSLMQVLTVKDAWDESSITWNNAPLAVENVAAAEVDVIQDFPGWPGVPTVWDVSYAVAEAYKNGTPLHLALYEADWAYHSGKYFVSAETGDWNAAARPTLKITWGEPAFIMDVTPAVQHIKPGDVTTYTVLIHHSDEFNPIITLDVAAPAPDLDLTLSPLTATSSGSQATLTLTDNHPSSFSSGVWYTIPFTATGGGMVQTTTAKLLLNGQQLYLPITIK